MQKATQGVPRRWATSPQGLPQVHWIAAHSCSPNPAACQRLAAQCLASHCSGLPAAGVPLAVALSTWPASGSGVPVGALKKRCGRSQALAPLRALAVPGTIAG